MDLALQGGLRGTQDLQERAFTYDVICMYLRKLLERFRVHFPDLVPLVEDLLCCLPKFHSHAHKELCQIVYALSYTTGFGLSHGEGVETPWAELNFAGLTTREMTAGARHDALNDLFNFWNRQKLENIGKPHHTNSGQLLTPRQALICPRNSRRPTRAKFGQPYTWGVSPLLQPQKM